MSQRSRLVGTWGSVVLTVLLSLIVALVTFRLMESSAEATVTSNKLGGGIAAFAVTFGMLSSAFKGIYRLIAQDEVEELSGQIHELQMKLLKGAPCPKGYSIDIDERHNLIYSRPNGWRPAGGILFNYASHFTAEGSDSPFRPNFVVQFLQDDELKSACPSAWSGKRLEVEKLYEQQLEGVRALTKEDPVQEYASIDQHKSLKYINTWTMKGVPEPIRQLGVLTYVPQLKGMFVFTYSELESRFLATSETFEIVMSSVRFT